MEKFITEFNKLSDSEKFSKYTGVNSYINVDTMTEERKKRTAWLIPGGAKTSTLKEEKMEIPLIEFIEKPKIETTKKDDTKKTETPKVDKKEETKEEVKETPKVETPKEKETLEVKSKGTIK